MNLTLPKAYTNTNYAVAATHWNVSSSTTAPVRVNTRTTTSMVLKGAESKSISALFITVGY